MKDKSNTNNVSLFDVKDLINKFDESKTVQKENIMEGIN